MLKKSSNPITSEMMPNPNLNSPGKAPLVREMFGEIASTYDRVNGLLSLNIDSLWRAVTVNELKDLLTKPGAIALDLCCGTADLTLQIEEHAYVIGCDFCHPMLVLGNKKIVKKSASNACLTEGDALRLPFAESSFDVVTIAFGLRNLEHVEGGLAEMLRVLKPGGRTAILEFSRPIIPVFRTLFEFYFNAILPRIGRIISGSTTAYQYLPRSVSNFPDQKELSRMMRAVGYLNVHYHNLFGGIVAVHLGERA
jgi:demethylmenaquinone methyltransferase / 2-methoxy-6-polyprenyl-1,4-benzoquinol methylase